MISKQVLKELCKRTGLHIYQQEKDYLIKLFLYNYFRRFNDAVFKGGTCIRYLYGTDRFSEDIDFNITNSPAEFAEQVKFCLKEIKLDGINNGFIKKEFFETSFTCEIYFYGPLFKGNDQTRNKFRINAGIRGRMIKKSRWELIGSEYPETRNRFLIQTMAEDELIVEKVITMFNRKKGRDLYDIWCLLKSGLEVNAKLLKQKGKENLKFTNYPSKNEYERDMEKVTTRTISYEQVRNDVEKKLKGLL